MNLLPSQELQIQEILKRTTDLNEIVQTVFQDVSLDGRSKQGRLIREYLITNRVKFKTTRREKAQTLEFSPEQKSLIIREASSGKSSLAIARLIFSNQEVSPLSNEQRAVLDVIRETNPDFTPTIDVDTPLNNYVAPKSPGRIIKKINDATGNNLEEEKLNRQHKICADRLGINLNNSRFLKIVNNYTSKEDRILFEEEFVRLTWDKPDLTSDELNLYMNVCKEIINLEIVSKHLNKLNDAFDLANDNDEFTVRLAEIIKAKSSEYHQCESRIENLTKKLQGDRSERMKSRHKENSSILSLVQFFQDEEERVNMVRIAEMQRQLVKDEAEKIEGMSDWKARVLGISIEDVL